MKITRFNKGYSIRLTENEMGILRAMEALTGGDMLWGILNADQRRSLTRRDVGGKKKILRLDADKRTEYAKQEDPEQCG